ncbi:MAG: hypothetical protein QG639_845 [Patescibacteria group bacterium]|nr:hypothetical protein [Patescibacteria group bacterium]
MSNMNKHYTPFFSIVIPTLNEEKYLPKLLKDLSSQTFENFEVIVVDGNSEDTTVKKATTFKKKLNLKIIPVTKRNVSFQRNTGVSQTKGDWVIFMDADNRLPHFFLEGIKYQLAKFPEVEVFTTWLSVEGNSKIDKLIENSINLDIEIYTIMGNPKSMGALMGIKKTLFKKHHFDEKQQYMEDSMLVRELCDAGHCFKIFREPKFYYSLRRIKKVGNVQMLQTMMKYQFHYLLGGDFSKPYSAEQYPMLGGSYYDVKDKPQRWYSRIHHFIKTASQKQLEQARKVLNTLNDSEQL